MSDDHGIMPGPNNFRRLADAAAFRAWRKELGLSQTEAGRRIGGLSLRAVQFYEHAGRPIPEIVRRRMEDLTEKQSDAVRQPMVANLAVECPPVGAVDDPPPITGPAKMMVKFSVSTPDGWRNFERECPPEVLAEASRRHDGITWLGRQLEDARFADVTAMVWEPGI